MSSEIVERLREDWEMLKDGYQENLSKTWHDHAMENAAKDALEAASHIEALESLNKDLADCLEDMTKHYVEVRNDLYGFEAEEEIEVIAARKLISQAKE